MTRKQSSLFPDSDTSDTLNVLRGLDRAEVEPLAFKIISSNPADPTTRGTGPAAAKIFGTLWALKKDGQSEDTLRAKGDRLRFLAKHVDLDNPEAVKGYIASQSTWSKAYKQRVAYAYDSYVKTNGLEWSLPRFRIEDRLSRIPTEDRINQVIVRARGMYVLVFSILRDTGMRLIELERTKTRDIDLRERNNHGSDGKRRRWTDRAEAFMTYIKLLGA